jgi:lipoprotein-releasing system ATP-binding protein
MTADLIVHQLSKSYPTADGELSILRGVELEMVRGDTLAITGPSGSGKSTLLYILGLLDQPNSGTVTLAGESPLRLDPQRQAAFRNRHIGFVFQDHHLLPQCTVLENVLLPTIPAADASASVEQRARQLLERVGLSHRLAHRPAQLSGGERQRVAVCRALINQPVLLLADEPTGNLDRATAEAVGSLLLDLNREQHTMLICVTHSLELAQRFPRRMRLVDGKLADGG